jgi:hypothetical protein
MALTFPPQILRIHRVDQRARPARRRPFGVWVIALLQALNALGYALGIFTGIEPPVTTMGPQDLPEIVAGVMLAFGLVVALGLLMLKRWAWVATMLWVGAIMAGELSLYLRGEDANFFVMAISVAQVFYLNLSEVQACFEDRKRSEALTE